MYIYIYMHTGIYQNCLCGWYYYYHLRIIIVIISMNMMMVMVMIVIIVSILSSTRRGPKPAAAVDKTQLLNEQFSI